MGCFVFCLWRLIDPSPQAVRNVVYRHYTILFKAERTKVDPIYVPHDQLDKRQECSMRKYPRPLSLDHKMDIHLIAKLNSLYEAWHELFVNGAENRMNIRYGSKTLFCGDRYHNPLFFLEK